MFGLSRLGYSLALNRQIPSLVGRLHPRHNTPVVLIGLGALLAVALVIPTDLEFLAAIYAFGATLAFTLVHLSVIRLRFREPDRDRPYKVPFNVRVGPRRAAAHRGARRRDGGGRLRLGAGPARRRALRRHGLDGVRRAALRDLPHGRGQAGLQARDRARQGAHAAGRRGGVRLDPRAGARARRSTTTSCRPPGGWRARRTRTTARAAR